MKKIFIAPLLLCSMLALSAMRSTIGETQKMFEQARVKKEKDAPIAKKGKLLFKDDFNNGMVYSKEYQQVADGWRVRANHAKWKQENNSVKSIFESGHMPVLTYEGNFKDAIIELEFKFFAQEGKWSACRISATNPQLNPRAYAASVWANANNTGRALGMVLEHDEWKPGVITTVMNKPATFEPGKWYTLRLELIGNVVRATCNGVTVIGTHEKFGIPKNSISLGVGTSPHELRKFRVYEASKK
ncbi:DUF1080 domain-containing protein [Pedobacter aquae]|uniref:DUF1080 domain-containing protein n=1 Tax=Pedobacter aquae TaxID=2605747 RepID=A0A5C0VPA2_9SPHI|nr:family 16 glycoside hydrolase [Pedobacter aquae]QEK53160.1 DUF1080 domain-containing protein [Pedobacter aquae]